MNFYQSYKFFRHFTIPSKKYFGESQSTAQDMKRKKHISPHVEMINTKFIQTEDYIISLDINYQNISLPQRYNIHYLNKLQLATP